MKIDDLIKLLCSIDDDDRYVLRAAELSIFEALLGRDRGRWRLMLHPYHPDKYLSVLTRLDAARQLFMLAFPGWLYRVMECSVSDDAWVIPDFNHPEHGAELQARFPDAMREPVEWFGTDISMTPGGCPSRALCISMLLAKKKVLETEAAEG